MKTNDSTKHTSGPWWIHPGSPSVVRESVNDSAIAVECSICDARLIAVAPELLAALELAQATIDRLTVKHGHFSSTQGTRDVIRAALFVALWVVL